MKKVLIISYSFPPINDGAIHRIIRLGRWMPQYGWEPVILTCKNRLFHRADAENIFFIRKYFQNIYEADSISAKLLSSLSKIRNYYIKNFLNLFFWQLFLPDRYFYWYLPGITGGSELIKRHHIELIWATIPNYTNGLIGSYLSQKNNIPLLIDYRDPWTLSEFHKTSKIKRKINTILERKMLKQTDAICTTSKPMRQLFIDNKYFDERMIFTITNSFDSEMQYMNINSKSGIDLDKNKVNITHVGSFYGDRQPFTFTKALAQIVKKEPSLRQRVKVNFIGMSKYQQIADVCDENHILDMFYFEGFVTFKKSMSYLYDSDILLVLNGKADDNSIFIPAKLFDCLYVKKPILFIGKGQPSEIIKELNIGESAEHDISEIQLKLSLMLSNLENYKTNNDVLKKYNSMNISKSMVEVFEKILYESTHCS